MKYKIFALLIVVVLVITACGTPPSTPSMDEPTEEPTQGTTMPTPMDNSEQVAPEASQAALQALSEHLGVSKDALIIRKIEDAQWLNSCLELPQTDEACAEVITPGFSFEIEGNSQTYEVRTNENGSIVRLATTATGSEGSDIPAVIEARKYLATRLGIADNEIPLVSVEEEEWPNGCLGLEKPGEMCTQVIVPGYRITFEVNGQSYVFRTNRDGTRIAEENGQKPGSISQKGLVLAWQRSGGIAGFCDYLGVFETGQAIATNCKGNIRHEIELTDAQKDQLNDWVGRFGSVAFEQKDPAVADAMTLRLAINGSGSGTPTDDDKTAMLEFAQSIFTSATQ